MIGPPLETSGQLVNSRHLDSRLRWFANPERVRVRVLVIANLAEEPVRLAPASPVSA